VIVPVDGNGEVCFETSGAGADLIADVNGWFAVGAGFAPLVPSRVFDTRSGDGGVPAGKVVPGVPLRVRVTGRAGVPVSGVGAVSLNVTVTRAVGDGFATVFPCASGVPLASSLNYVTGQTVPNAVIVPVDGNGEVCFETSGAGADLIADVNGWFAST
jgi:hypothetical protein